mgnify:CR=1 FL=1
MQADTAEMSRVLAIHLQLIEYPILARAVREQMRQELFARGIITRQQFEEEVRKKALRTQEKEGLTDPFGQESPEDWAERLRTIRDHLTEFYFALNLPHALFEDLLQSAIRERMPGEEVVLTFNPELASWDLLFAQAARYEKLPPAERRRVRHHLQEIAVVLIRGLISDHLDFVGVAREYLDIHTLREIHRRRIGRGKIGGKAAGMVLAHRILQRDDPADPLPLSSHVTIPDSYFIGADAFYDFLAYNGIYLFNQKYKTRDEIEADYPETYERLVRGQFPEDFVDSLAMLVERLGSGPLIVRSSSLLEDSFGGAFAGKYDSFFCPNQGTLAENLAALLDAIRRVYASTFKPDALFYRQQVGLVDYDERMAILIQRVAGSRYGRYFFPAVAGVAFGRNPWRWNRHIRREDGFMRIVWGLGTRAVERVAHDYPRMVALSHPHLRPEITAADMRKYSQHLVDVIDLEDNTFQTRPISEIIGADYPFIELLASVDEGDYIRPFHFTGDAIAPHQFVLTFDRLLKDRTFITLMKAILSKLERAYGRPVDVEFTVEIQPDPASSRPRFMIHLLQCRPLSSPAADPAQPLPAYIPAGDIVLTSTRLVPQGLVSRIAYVVYVPPERYARIPDQATRREIGRIVGRLNKRLAGQRYILVGPGRWGSVNLDLGVSVSYADIYNAAMLVEIAFAGPDGTPEVSYGTHFFQDLVEAHIYPLALFPEEEGTIFNRAFFEETPNVLADLLPDDAGYAEYVRVIDVPAVTGGRFLEVVMNSEEEKAVGYVRQPVTP